MVILVTCRTFDVSFFFLLKKKKKYCASTFQNAPVVLLLVLKKKIGQTTITVFLKTHGVNFIYNATLEYNNILYIIQLTVQKEPSKAKKK